MSTTQAPLSKITLEEELVRISIKDIDSALMRRVLDITLAIDTTQYPDIHKDDQLAIYAHIYDMIYNSMCGNLKLNSQSTDVPYREHVQALKAFNSSYRELTQIIGETSPNFEYLAALQAVADLFEHGKLDDSNTCYLNDYMMLLCLNDRSSSIKSILQRTHRQMYFKFMDSHILKCDLSRHSEFQTAYLYLEKKISKYDALDIDGKRQLAWNCYQVSINSDPVITINNLDCFSSINPEFDRIIASLKTLLDLGTKLDKDVVQAMATNEQPIHAHSTIIEFN